MVDFGYYCDDFGGFIIDNEEEFDRLRENAADFVRGISRREPDYDSDDIKSCICAVADVYAENCLYGKEADAENGILDELMHTARLYLPPMLMYYEL